MLEDVMDFLYSNFLTSVRINCRADDAITSCSKFLRGVMYCYADLLRPVLWVNKLGSGQLARGLHRLNWVGHNQTISA